MQLWPLGPHETCSSWCTRRSRRSGLTGGARRTILSCRTGRTLGASVSLEALRALFARDCFSWRALQIIA